MDSNYEAQNQFTRQRLSARREHAAAERLLREGRPARTSGLKKLLVRLLRQTRPREKKKSAQQFPHAAVATTGKDKG